MKRPSSPSPENPLDRPEQLRELDRLPVELVFDTADYPLPAGIRRRDVTSRHLLFQAEDLCLDLRLERETRGPRVAVVGQLANAGDPVNPLAYVPVLMTSGEEILARTTSNRMGEFQLECEPTAEMTLCLPVGDDRVIEVPVDRRTTRRPS